MYRRPHADPTREDLATQYLEQLPYAPYPLQEEAILSYFMSERGVLVCAPTGTGKTLIAEAALFEALNTNTVAYYTTPLIALTEQKYAEMQAAASVGVLAATTWASSPDTARSTQRPRSRRRRRNPAQPPVAPRGVQFDHVSAVVMDEFHSFADPERGIVWNCRSACCRRRLG